MAQRKLVAAGPRLQRALQNLANGAQNTDLTPPQKINRSQSILTRMGEGGKSSAYNGYFTIKDVSTYNEDGTVQEFRVAVCDGETWDAETQTSGDSIAYCMGNDIHFQSTILTLTESSDIYIKCGPANTYFNRIVYQRQGATKPSRLGYEYLIVGTVRIQDGALSIIQRLMGANSGGSIYVPYAQYYGPLSIRHVENCDNDSVVEGKIAVCNGKDWNPRTQQSSGSPITVGGDFSLKGIDATILSVTSSTAIYAHVIRPIRGRYSVEAVTSDEPLSVEPGKIEGYTLIAYHYDGIHQCVPSNGIFNIWLVNNACTNEIIIKEE